MFGHYISRPSPVQDVATETTSLLLAVQYTGIREQVPGATVLPS